MKNRFARLMSVLLCVCMILSTFGFSVVAEENAVTEYYVQKGATGDGRSETSPAGSVADVVTAINADGHTTGDEVTVFVIDSGEGTLCEESEVIASDIVLGYNDGTPNHKATIRYTSYSDDVRSVIAHKNWENNVWSDHLKLCGPTIFDNIALLEMRNTHNSMTDLVFNRYSVEFNNVIYYTLGTDNSVSLAINEDKSGKAHLTIGANRINNTFDGNQDVVIDDADYFKNIVLLGYTDAGNTQTLNGDLTVRINSGSFKELELNSSAGQEIVKGDLNLILSGNTSVGEFKNTNKPVVEGNMQIIVNPGVSVPGYIGFFYAHSSADKTADTPRYVLYVKDENVNLDITDTVGTYSADTEAMLYVPQNGGRTVYYGTNGITVPAPGDYEVYAAASLDEIKAIIPEAPAPLMEFNGWTDDGNGTLTANFVARAPKHATYYVQHAGSGDGLTTETPVATVADAIALINDAGLGEGDTAEIFVMNDDSELGDKPFYMYSDTGVDMEFWNCNGKDIRGRLTAWAWDGGIVEAYKAKVTITGYTDDAYLAYSTRIGHNTNMILNGPTEFKNLTIVATRSSDRELFTNGYDTTFTNVAFAYEMADEYADIPYEGIWDGQMRVMLGGSDGVYQNNWDTVDGKGGKIVFDSPIDNYGGPYGLVLIGQEKEHTEYENPVTIYLNGASENGSIVWGTGSAKTYAPFSIVINNGTYENKVYDSSNFNAEGGIQVIANNGTTPVEIPEIVYGNKWTLTTKDADITLDVTDKAGSFAVAGDKIAYAISNHTVYFSVDSVLTLPAGTYDVYSADTLDEVKTEAAALILTDEWKIASWETLGDNAIVANIVANIGEENVYYVQFGGNGDGLTAETPVATVNDAIALINAAGLTEGDTAYIYIMNDDLDGVTIEQGYPEFYWYSDAGAWMQGCNLIGNNGTDVIRGRFTAWTYNDGELPNSHTAKIVVKGYTDDAYLAYSTRMGANSPMILGGPTEFENLTIVATRLYDQPVYTNGFDTTFTNVDFGYQSGGQWDNDKYNGVYSGHMRVMLGAKENMAGGGGTVTFNSPLPHYDNNISAGQAYGLNVLNNKYVEFTKPVTVYLNGESENGTIVWGTSESKMTSGNPFSIVINKGSYESVEYDTKTLWADGGVQVIANNGTSPIALPGFIVGNTWTLASADTNGNTIDVTETAGTFKVNSELEAVARNTVTGGLTRSNDGFLTLEAGSYEITYEEHVEELITIYADGEYFGQYPKGEYVTTPTSPEDNYLYKFGGWAKDGELFAWGDETVQFNEDTYLTAIWNIRGSIEDHDEYPTLVVFFDEVDGNDENDGLTKDTPVKTMEKAFALAEASDAETKKIAIIGAYTAATLPEHESMITLTGSGFEESFFNLGGTIFTNGPMTFEYLTINAVEYKFINANSEKLVIGKGIKNASGSFGFATHINNENSDSATGNVKIYSDSLVYVGSYYNDKRTSTDGALVTINSGSPFVTFCGDGWGDWQQGPVFTGKPVSIVHNGGTPTISTTKNRYTPYFETDVQYISNYGIDVAELPEFNIADGYGLYVLNSAWHESLSTIEPTDVAGTFKVNAPEELDAVATASNGLSIRSVDGILTLTPGTYAVHYEEHVDQLFNVYTDEKLHATVPAGGESTLPWLGNNYIYDFKGWKDINAEEETIYGPGATIEVNSDMQLESVWWTREVDHNVFFDEVNGNDENDGLTKDTPVKTMARAVAIADNSEIDKPNRKIAIIGTFTVSSATENSLPAHNNMIRLTGDGFDESVIKLESSLNTNGPIRFEFITIDANQWKFINTDSHKIEFNDGVKLAESSAELATHINRQNYNSASGEIVISTEGLNCTVYAGSYYNTDTRTTDGALITVEKGNPVIKLFADASGDQNYPTVFTGKPVSIVQFGGKPTVQVYERGIFETSVQYIVNYATEAVDLPEIEFAEGHGLYVLKTVYSESWNYLEPTDTAGVFNVIGTESGTMTVIATSEDGKQYASQNDVLTVPAGTYTVEFVDDIIYTNRGDEIEFYQDYNLDITTITATKKDGKMFIGWTDEAGNAVTNFNFTAGTVLKAAYIDFTEEDFGITGAQIRLKDADVKQGLRFIVKKSAGLDELNISEYGSVIVPSLALGKGTLTLGGVYNYNNKDYAAKTVPAAKLFSKNDEFEEYTVCVTHITEEDYNMMFTVRGYINYTDLNGVARTLYTDYYATNIVNVAKAGIDAGDENSEYFQEIVDTVKANIKAKYAVSDVNTRTIPTNNIDGSLVSIEGNAAKYITDFYQLGGAGEDMIISEVTIETGKTDVEPLEIFQLSDTHFNYVNAQDFADNDEVIMSSYRGRKWLADGASVPNTVRSLEYASQGDFTVVTGDVLDYLSWGAIELTQKYIFDTYPDTFITLGNHDPSKFCQTDRNDVVDYTSREYKYQWLQDNWNHDVYYTSTVLDNRLMIIQIDNGSDVFWENQIEPLKNDLETARANDYDVLMFYHIPLVTNNPDEVSVTPIRRNDTGAYNYRGEGGAFIGNKSADWATWEVYDLIKTNADIIDGTFCGHMHSNYYTEIIGTNPDGTAEYRIPQFVISGTPYDGGHVMKITVK